MAFRRAESGCSLSAAQRPWMLRYLRPPYSEKMQGRYVAGAFSEPAGDRLCWKSARLHLSLIHIYAQCERLEERVRGFTKKPLLEDVDGTLIQIYVYPRGHVIIKNDEMLGDVPVESEFDLKPFDALLRVKK